MRPGDPVNISLGVRDGRGLAVRGVGREGKVRTDLDNMREFVPCIRELYCLARLPGLSLSNMGNSINSTSRRVEPGVSLQFCTLRTVIKRAPPTFIFIISSCVLSSYAPSFLVLPEMWSEGVLQSQRQTGIAGEAAQSPYVPRKVAVKPCPHLVP